MDARLAASPLDYVREIVILMRNAAPDLYGKWLTYGKKFGDMYAYMKI